MDRRKSCGGGLLLLVIVITVIILGFWFFSVGGESKILETVQGNDNKIENEQKHEISLLHIDNLGNSIDNLDEKINHYSIINWSLILVIFVFIISYISHQLYKMPRKVKENINKNIQDDRIMEHENALLEMGYLKAKKKKKKRQPKKEPKVKQTKKDKNKDEDDSGEDSDENAI